MIRCGLDIGSGAVKCSVLHIKGEQIDELFSHQTPLLLGEYFCKHSRLDREILEECKAIIKGYVDRARLLGTPRGGYRAVATQVFRQVKNGQEFLQALDSELGVRCEIIQQRMEGRLGYLSAESSLLSSSNLIIWDSGGGSFQLSNYCEYVLNGPIGSANVKHALIHEVQGKERGVDEDSPNPCSREDVDGLREWVRNRLKGVEFRVWKERIECDGNVLVGIGGDTCCFRIASLLLDSKCIRADQLERGLYDGIVGKSDSELQEYPQCELVVPKLVLVLTVLELLETDRFTYCYTNGNTRGVCLCPQLWE